MQGLLVQSLLGELRSGLLHGAAKKINPKTLLPLIQSSYLPHDPLATPAPPPLKMTTFFFFFFDNYQIKSENVY